MQKTTKIIVALCLITLSSCSGNKTVETPRYFDSSLKTECEGIVSLRDKATMYDLVQWGLVLRAQYQDCSTINHAKALALSKLETVEVKP